MSIRRTLALTLGAVALTTGGLALAHIAAEASAQPIVVERFLLGYFDRKGKFVPTSGRDANNVDRNAIAMWIFSGIPDAGPNLRASLPLTLRELADLEKKIQSDPDYDPTRDGYEPGAIPRRRVDDIAARYVATGTISLGSFNFGAQTAGGGFTDPKGQFFKVIKPGTKNRLVPNRIIFNPRYLAATFNKPGEIDYNPEGLEANTTYQCFLEGGNVIFNQNGLVRNTSGDAMAAPFSTTFTTGTRYVQDYNRPEIRETTPTDLAINVTYDADIDLTFNEPMDAASFVLPKSQADDQYTFRCRYADSVAINGTLAGKNVLGIVRVKPQTAGNVIQFRPLQGFGKGPYKIDVSIGNGVTDLSGNNLFRQFDFSFTTERNLNAEEFDTIVENFTNAFKRDTTFVPSGDNLAAQWASPTGFLTTTVQETNFSFNGPAAVDAQGVNLWFSGPVKFQNMTPASFMGTRVRLLNGAAWQVGRFASLGNNSYPGYTCTVEHANDNVAQTGLAAGAPAGNFNANPILVTPSTTYRPGVANTGAFQRLPAWVYAVTYDAQHPFILEIQHGGSGNTATQGMDYWKADVSYSQTTFSSNINPPSINWLFSTRFFFLTPGAEAQSLFYDIVRNNARIQPQQLLPSTQPQGTAISFLWQGAKDDVTNPGVPDQSSLTAWISDIRQLTNYRFIRFRATLINDFQTGQYKVANLDSVTIPYTFR